MEGVASKGVIPVCFCSVPAKKYFGRSAIREVTDRRLPLLNSYLQGLVALPDKIRYDTIVTGFVRATSDDLARPYAGNQAYKSRPNGAVKPDRPARPQPPRSVEKPQRPPPMTLRYVHVCICRGNHNLQMASPIHLLTCEALANGPLHSKAGHPCIMAHPCNGIHHIPTAPIIMVTMTLQTSNCSLWL